jgi:FkbM family methyltransferase
MSISWTLSVATSRWRNRLRYVAAGPFVYRNWWQMYLVKVLRKPVVLELRNGAKYHVRPRSTDLAVVNESSMLNGYLGPGHLKVSSDAIIVDVGANIGDFTVRAARLCPLGRVFAIEPSADECRCIRRQVELNGLENVTVLDMALAGEDGEIELYSAGSHSSAYWGSGELQKVRAATLQSLMLTNRIETIDLLKLDCEGAEWDILPNAEAVLPRIRQLCLEFHNGKRTADWLEQWLRSRGFEVIRTSGKFNGLLWAWQTV